ncbi:hypothetical protein V2J09_004056 [Rumex salicifolius]
MKLDIEKSCRWNGNTKCLNPSRWLWQDRTGLGRIMPVEYNELAGQDGNPLEEVLRGGILRPRQIQQQVVQYYSKGDHVDEIRNGGWWYGKLDKCFRQQMYEIEFAGFNRPPMIEHIADIRPHCEWKKGHLYGKDHTSECFSGST